MASWFTRAIDRITPWDRQGEVQRRGERKKREEEEYRQRQQVFNQNRQSVSVEDPAPVSMPTPQRPRNIFEDLNKSLSLGQDRPGVVPVFKNQDTQVAQMPQPGTVVQPEKPVEYNSLLSKRGLKSLLPGGQTPSEALGVSFKDVDREAAGVVSRGAKWLAQGAARIPETVIRTVAQPGAEALYGSKVDTSQKEKNTGLRRRIYGEEPIQTYYKQGEELGKMGAEATGKPGLEKYGILAAPILGGLDLVFSGKSKVAKKLAEEKTAQGIIKILADKGIGVSDEVAESIAKNANPKQIEDIIKQQGQKSVKAPPVKEVVGDNLDIPASPTPPKVRQLENKVEELSQEANQLNRPAYQRQPAKDALNRVQVELSDARAKELGVGDSSLDRPAYKHQADIEDVVRQGNDELDNFISQNPYATPQQIQEAKLAIENQVIKKTDELTKARYGEVAETPSGAPTVVQPSSTIAAPDQTVIPQNLPETPGTVRVTSATDPTAAKTQAVAEAPVVTRPIPVESQSEGFAPTGEFKVGKRGNVSETASNATEVQAGTSEMANRSVDDLLDEVATKESLTPGDRRRIAAAKENLIRANPDARTTDKWKLLDRLEKAGRSDLGRGLALIPRTIRKTASADALTNRTISKIDNALSDGTKLSDADYKVIQDANDKFTAARDAARQAEEQFKLTHSKVDLKAVKKARKAEMDADLAAKTTEVNTAQRVLKGSKESNAAKVVNDLEKEADLNMMDYVTSSQLSGPATGSRNLVGTELAGIENRVGANLRAKVVKGIFGENVGGFDRSGARVGRKEGLSKMVGDAKRRSDYAGRNPLKHARNFGTTINTAGESSLHSTTQSRLKAYYKQQLKDQGVSGERLANDAEFLRLTDPDGMGEIFMDTAMKSSGLTGIYQKSQKIEQVLSRGLAQHLGKALPPGASDALAKGMVRIAFGYPTATLNFLAQSSKRLLVGLPSAAESGIKAAKGDKKGAALAMDRALKEAGSGLAALTVGTALANADKVTGFYPEDKDERQRWTDEGKTELSINIGGTWHPIPQGFGMFGLPLIVASQFKEGGAESVADMFTNREKISKLLPTDQAYGALQILAGDSTTNQDKSFVASTIRSFIPVGSFLNQTAKGLDQTANDTTTKDFWRNVYDQVITGIPGVNNMSDIPDKLSSTGEPIKNPNLLQTYTGARSIEQSAGIENSKKVDEQINSTLSQIDQYGLLNDPNMEGVLEGTALEALTKANAGRQLDESDIKALKEGLVKGVSQEGTDTPYLEREQYDTNLAVLNLKRDLMKEDPTVKPSSLKDIDMAITRGEIYKDNKIPYDLIEAYRSTSVTEWRNMGDPDDEDYNPKMYQKLFNIDKLLADKKVSLKYGDPEKAKYYAKKSGSGRGGGRGSRQTDFSFGTLEAGTFAPRVREYESIGVQSGGVPRIAVKRPNIVHKITASG